MPGMAYLKNKLFGVSIAEWYEAVFHWNSHGFDSQRAFTIKREDSAIGRGKQKVSITM